MSVVWCVGQTTAETPDGRVWNIHGIYTSEAAALVACDGHPEFWIGPMPLDQALPYDVVEWTGAYYPSSVTN